MEHPESAGDSFCCRADAVKQWRFEPYYKVGPGGRNGGPKLLSTSPFPLTEPARASFSRCVALRRGLYSFIYVLATGVPGERGGFCCYDVYSLTCLVQYSILRHTAV
jgi:hypothetical protein